MDRDIYIKMAAAIVAAVFFTAIGINVAGAQSATVIELTQLPCQFIEAEDGVDRGFKSSGKADCVAINRDSGERRVAGAKVLELKPGKYIFRVTNKSVSYDLGFWLRGKGLGRLTLPSVSGGGLTPGATKDYTIVLKAGEYLYSCPLNTTPDYRLVVKG